MGYLNGLGPFLFLITVFEGANRYVLHHERRSSTSGYDYDVELTIKRALEKFPGARARIISDNGSQITGKEFKDYIRQKGLNHVRTSVAYPQSTGKLEPFHGTGKQASIRKRSYVSLEDARELIDDYITCYNTKRLHSAIYFLTPEDVLLG